MLSQLIAEMLQEEFGEMTPQQLAAPVHTVEVSAISQRANVSNLYLLDMNERHCEVIHLSPSILQEKWKLLPAFLKVKSCCQLNYDNYHYKLNKKDMIWQHLARVKQWQLWYMLWYFKW